MRCARRAPRAQWRSTSERGATPDARQCPGYAGRIIGCLAIALGAAASPRQVAAQSRELKSYGPGAPEAKLMLYYSSTVAFSSVGVPFGVGRPPALAAATGRSAPRVEASVEVSYLPRLSPNQRRAELDKPESTNLAPVFARPRVGVRLPGGVGAELSWIPPVRVFSVKANLFAGALSRAFDMTSHMRVIPRVSALAGRVEGPITCNHDTADDGDPALATYYAFVCYNNDSRDHFEPRHLSGELLFAARSASRWQPYVSAGARAEHTKFDIGVIRPDGSRDPDNPVLEVSTTRAYGTAGASWLGIRRTRLAAEVYYAPGSVVTARVLAGVHLW
jgi:hypothetical protein